MLMKKLHWHEGNIVDVIFHNNNISMIHYISTIIWESHHVDMTYIFYESLFDFIEINFHTQTFPEFIYKERQVG